MTVARRIICCLDVDRGRVVKGVCFQNMRDAGDPAEVAQRYNDGYADELVMLDISASSEGRDITLNTVLRIASCAFIPLTIGGGIRNEWDIEQLLRSGADKVSINTAALVNPDFVARAARQFGSQCIVVALDAKNIAADDDQPRWILFSHGGTQKTDLLAVEYAKKMADMGAGEILLTSMDRDGTRIGFDTALTAAVSNAVTIPVIASGGGGCAQHFYDAFTIGCADAALASSIFHDGVCSIVEIKNSLRNTGIAIR